MVRSTMLWAVIALLVGCSRPQVELSEAEARLAVAVDMPETVLLEAKARGENLRQLRSVDAGGLPVEVSGITVDVGDDAAEVVEELRGRLGEGYLVFVSDRNFGMAPDGVSIMPGTDQLDILRVMQTNGWNYDIGPDSVVARIRSWDARFGLDIYAAGFDFLEARFERRPADMPAFARELYEFCPDVVDQGTETIEAVAEGMVRSGVLYLWWD